MSVLKVWEVSPLFAYSLPSLCLKRTTGFGSEAPKVVPIISNNSLLYLETQNTVASRLLGMILNNFIVNPFRIMSLGSKDHFFEKFLAYELRFCW